MSLRAQRLAKLLDEKNYEWERAAEELSALLADPD
jgi:hypothetical protein